MEVIVNIIVTISYVMCGIFILGVVFIVVDEIKESKASTAKTTIREDDNGIQRPETC